MANRLGQQKPDPAIQRNIIRARRAPQNDRTKGIVVTASLAATLLGAAFFAEQDARTAAVEVSTTTQQVAATSAQPDITGAIGTAVSNLEGLWTTFTSSLTSQSGSSQTTGATAAGTTQSATTSQAAVATTRSSR